MRGTRDQESHSNRSQRQNQQQLPPQGTQHEPEKNATHDTDRRPRSGSKDSEPRREKKSETESLRLWHSGGSAGATPQLRFIIGIWIP